jgi:hypothetical protein
MNHSVYTIISYFYSIQFNINLPSTKKYHTWSLLLIFSDQNSLRSSISAMRVTYSDHLILLVWITKMIGILSISCRVQITKNSQNTSRSIGKRGTVSSWQHQIPYSQSNGGENSRTTAGTSWTTALQPGLGPVWLASVWSAKNHLGGKRFADEEEIETEVRKWLRQQSKDFFYVVGFDAPVKRWDKCISVDG